MTATARQAIIMDLLFVRAGLMATNGPILPVSLPEQLPPFAAPADGKYLDVQLMPNTPRWEGLNDDVIDQGLLQVMVVWKKNEGLIAPLNAAGLVAAWFPKGLNLYSGGVRVRIDRRPVIAKPLTEPDKSSTPVTIYWTA